MASIVKRKNKWAVIYSCVDENGVKHQKWESFATNAEAKKRKAQVEFQQATDTFIVPSAKTISELLDEYVSTYGINTWAASTYESKRGLIDNYVIPVIGDIKLDDVNPRMMNSYYQKLLSVKAKSSKFVHPHNEYVSVRTVKEIHKVLRNAFNQAVKWELMSRNPVLNCTLPKCEEKPRDIWTPEQLVHALENCEDDILSLALNLAFSCSLRMGEMLGLTWDCVEISDDSIRKKNAYIYVNKELQRVTKNALDVLDGRDVMFTFPAVMAKNNTTLVLKTPKTKTSVRKVFLPTTVANMLVERKKQLAEYKEYFGDEFYDYNLVFCNTIGRPIEGQAINRLLNELIKTNGLPKVVFHSIRHTSTTYKLKLSGGDIKAVQGDTGHAQATMVTERYAHILDDDRRFNAERFEDAFYGGYRHGENSQEVPVPEKHKMPPTTADKTALDAEAVMRLLQQSPDMMEKLKQMVMQAS
ncbi:MAG: site-specific integrase [Bacilli bacterium]|nr:site-specific integrase [Bacilli bacterium]